MVHQGSFTRPSIRLQICHGIFLDPWTSQRNSWTIRCSLTAQLMEFLSQTIYKYGMIFLCVCVMFASFHGSMLVNIVHIDYIYHTWSGYGVNFEPKRTKTEVATWFFPHPTRTGGTAPPAAPKFPVVSERPRRGASTWQDEGFGGRTVQFLLEEHKKLTKIWSET